MDFNAPDKLKEFKLGWYRGVNPDLEDSSLFETLEDSIMVPQVGSFSMNKIAFYAGEPSHKQEQVVNQLMELIENIDEVMSAKSRFENMARG